MIRSGLLRLFIPISLSSDTPVAAEIPLRVSPCWTWYVVAPSRAEANDCADRPMAIAAPPPAI
jgi:hypothetical protein